MLTPYIVESEEGHQDHGLGQGLGQYQLILPQAHLRAHNQDQDNSAIILSTKPT